MDLSLLSQNLLSPPILFFALGLLAAVVRSDLEIPQQIAKFLSLFLLLAIGFHGGHKLAAGPLGLSDVLLLSVAVLSSFVVPLWSFFLLRLRVGVDDAAAIAATYGSISAVTFITATSFLDAQGEPYGGHMVAAMALMESPAIVVGVLLHRVFARRVSRRAIATGLADEAESPGPIRWSDMLREAFLNGAVIVLLGSMVIGLLASDAAYASMQPAIDAPFKGILCIFLLDMGLVAGRRFGDLKRGGLFLGSFAIGAAIVHGLLGIAIAWLIAWFVGASHGDALLLAILMGSASYIAVPAAMRLSIPHASPSYYVPMALAITFPFNVAVAIPGYYWLITQVWPS